MRSTPRRPVCPISPIRRRGPEPCRQVNWLFGASVLVKPNRHNAERTAGGPRTLEPAKEDLVNVDKLVLMIDCAPNHPRREHRCFEPRVGDPRPFGARWQLGSNWRALGSPLLESTGYRDSPPKLFSTFTLSTRPLRDRCFDARTRPTPTIAPARAGGYPNGCRVELVLVYRILESDTLAAPSQSRWLPCPCYRKLKQLDRPSW